MPLKPWYDVIKPRKDLCQGHVPEASEFAVHLDQVRDGRASDEYNRPDIFFARTYLTHNLKRFAAEALRRLSGERVETNAIFHMITQFGGGKTHALTLLYHLAQHGAESQAWPGVQSILDEAGLSEVPRARTAVFVGTEFDPLQGRGGEDGTPRRQTPWGEIAYQLGGEQAFAHVAEHDRRRVAPGGDVIRRIFPAEQPCLLLMDEVLNYIARARRLEQDEHLNLDMIDQLYHFVHNLSEQIRGMDRVVLAISIPSMLVEMGEEDVKAFERYSKMLERVGRPILIAAESETSKIIRRRLFDWNAEQLTDGGDVLLPPPAQEACRQYAAWVARHRALLPAWFSIDHAEQHFLDTYPFHPSVFSVFERKWQALPRFQRTRGILRLLALWIARAYEKGYRDLHQDAIVGLGTAPLADRDFRASVRTQLGDDERLEAPIMTDICGDDAFASHLDWEASAEIKQVRLHIKAATAIFFESNGGMTGETRKEATEPEIRLAVSEPDLNIGNVETVLDALTAHCYYLEREHRRYRFSLLPNINKLFADRSPTIDAGRINARVTQEIKHVLRHARLNIIFPEASSDIPDRPLLTLAVLSPDYPRHEPETPEFIATLTRNYGASARTYKSAIIWIVPDDAAPLREQARALLTWQDIQGEMQHSDQHRRQDSAQQHTLLRQIAENIGKAASSLKEAVWQTYRYAALLARDNSIEFVDLGRHHSSSADSLLDMILFQLRRSDYVVDAMSPSFLTRNWAGGMQEWCTRAVRDAFFASPVFPRLLDPDVLKTTIAHGANNGLLAYTGAKFEGEYSLFYYKDEPHLHADEVEISDDAFIIPKPMADAYIARKEHNRIVTVLHLQPRQLSIAPGERVSFRVQALDQDGEEMPVVVRWAAAGGSIDQHGIFHAGSQEGQFEVSASADGHTAVASVTILPKQQPSQDQARNQSFALHSQPTRLTWRGKVTGQKWMNFYMKVLSRFAADHTLDIELFVTIARQEGISQQKIDEMKAALRELGLNDDVQ